MLFRSVIFRDVGRTPPPAVSAEWIAAAFAGEDRTPEQRALLTLSDELIEEVETADLIVMSQVSEGAEVLADGNIHIYGGLRGRALAGVKGDEAARIFCHSMEAELLSIAGNFLLSEDFQEQFLKQPVQVYLKDEGLCIDPL